MIRVLLVDDEAEEAHALRRTVRKTRGHPGIQIDDCRTAGAAIRRVGERHFDVVIVDWLLGHDEMDGLQLGRRVRSAGYEGGLLMLTGRCIRGEDEQAAFAAGFDDFVRKPAHNAVLVARIAALARRIQPAHRPRPHKPDAEWDGFADTALEVSRDEPMALVFSRPVALTPLEWRLLRALYARRGHAVPWTVLVNEGWGAPPADPVASAAKHLCRLRRLLGDDVAGLVETVRGYGARLRFRDQD